MVRKKALSAEEKRQIVQRLATERGKSNFEEITEEYSNNHRSTQIVRKDKEKTKV